MSCLDNRVFSINFWNFLLTCYCESFYIQEIAPWLLPLDSKDTSEFGRMQEDDLKNWKLRAEQASPGVIFWKYLSNKFFMADSWCLWNDLDFSQIEDQLHFLFWLLYSAIAAK